MPGLPSVSQRKKDWQADWAVDNASGLKMDPTFFMDFVVFQVHDCLFKVPRVYFENHSLYFKKMYLNPRFDGEIRGSSTNNPVVLEDISVSEFRDFLTFMCPPAGPREVSAIILNATIRLSTIWRFNGIRASAISTILQIQDTVPCAFIWMGLTYSVTALLKKGLFGVIKNRTVLNGQEKALLEECGAVRGIEKLKKGRGWRNISMGMVCDEFKDLLGRIEREEEVFGVVAGESTKYVDGDAGKERGAQSALEHLQPGAFGDLMRRMFEETDCTCGQHHY